MHSETPSLASTDKTVRHKQREIDSLTRDKKALEEQIDHLEEEIHSLKTHIPLPTSPMSTPKALASDDFEHTARLKARIVEFESQLASWEVRSARDVQRLEVQLRSAQNDLRAAQMELLSVNKSLDTLRGDQAVSVNFRV